MNTVNMSHSELLELIGHLVVGRDGCWAYERDMCTPHGWAGPGECPVARARRLVEEAGRG